MPCFVNTFIVTFHANNSSGLKPNDGYVIVSAEDEDDARIKAIDRILDKYEFQNYTKEQIEIETVEHHYVR